MLIAGRFIAGIAVGILSAIVPMYCVSQLCMLSKASYATNSYLQSEIAESSYRGALSGLLQFMLSWGYFAAQWIGYGCNYSHTAFQCKTTSNLSIQSYVLHL